MDFTNRRKFLQAAGSAAVGSLLASVPQRHARGLAAESRRKIKVGQIGTGHAHASGKMSTLRKLADDYEVVGIVETDAELRRKAEGQAAYRDLKWMTEDELLGTQGLEAVAVETTVPELVPTAARCAAAGLHMHLDKPAGASLDDFRRLLDAARAKKLAVQMGYMFRNNPAFQLCFRVAREGWLGSVFEIDAVMSKLISDRERAELARMPGGSMFELGCHLIDAIVAAMGRPSRVTPLVRRTRSGKGDELADNMLAVLEYPGATCTVRSALVEVEGMQRRQFVVCGDRGTADIRPLEPPRMMLALDEARGPYRRGYQEVELPQMPGRYDDQLIELARVIRGEINNPYPPSHDLAVHETILLASGMGV